MFQNARKDFVQKWKWYVTIAMQVLYYVAKLVTSHYKWGQTVHHQRYTTKDLLLNTFKRKLKTHLFEQRQTSSGAAVKFLWLWRPHTSLNFVKTYLTYTSSRTIWRSNIRCCQTTPLEQNSYACASTWFVLAHLPPQTENVFNCSTHQRLVTVAFRCCVQIFLLTYLANYL